MGPLTPTSPTTLRHTPRHKPTLLQTRSCPSPTHTCPSHNLTFGNQVLQRWSHDRLPNPLPSTHSTRTPGLRERRVSTPRRPRTRDGRSDREERTYRSSTGPTGPGCLSGPGVNNPLSALPGPESEVASSHPHSLSPTSTPLRLSRQGGDLDE